VHRQRQAAQILAVERQDIEGIELHFVVMLVRIQRVKVGIAIDTVCPPTPTPSPPAAGGGFVCTVVGAKSGNTNFLYARAATWIDGTMLRPDQTPLSKAEAADKSVAALLLLLDQ
jgi:hypothetical protein